MLKAAALAVFARVAAMSESNFNLSDGAKNQAEAAAFAENAQGVPDLPQTSQQQIAEPSMGKKGLSETELELLKRAQRRNLLIFALLGVLLALLGFFAGKNIRAQHDDAGGLQFSDDCQITLVLSADSDFGSETAVRLSADNAAVSDASAVLEADAVF